MRDGIQTKAPHPRAPASGRHVLGAREVNKLAAAAFRRDWPGTGVSGRHHSVSAPIQDRHVWFVITAPYRNTGDEVVPGHYRARFRFYNPTPGVEKWWQDNESGDRILDLSETGIEWREGDRVPCHFDWYRDCWVPTTLPFVPPVIDMQIGGGGSTDVQEVFEYEDAASPGENAELDRFSVVFLLERSAGGTGAWRVVHDRRVEIPLAGNMKNQRVTATGIWTPTLGNGDLFRLAAYVRLADATVQTSYSGSSRNAYPLAAADVAQAALRAAVTHRSNFNHGEVDSDDSWTRLEGWAGQNTVANVEQPWEAADRNQYNLWVRQFPVILPLFEDDGTATNFKFLCRPGEGWGVTIEASVTFLVTCYLGVVPFELTEDLTAGGDADAEQLIFNGTTRAKSGETITVHDTLFENISGDGPTSASDDGARGTYQWMGGQRRILSLEC